MNNYHKKGRERYKNHCSSHHSIQIIIKCVLLKTTFSSSAIKYLFISAAGLINRFISTRLMQQTEGGRTANCKITIKLLLVRFMLLPLLQFRNINFNSTAIVFWLQTVWAGCRSCWWKEQSKYHHLLLEEITNYKVVRLIRCCCSLSSFLCLLQPRVGVNSVRFQSGCHFHHPRVVRWWCWWRDVTWLNVINTHPSISPSNNNDKCKFDWCTGGKEVTSTCCHPRHLLKRDNINPQWNEDNGKDGWHSLPETVL